jgi:hypothetical protein
LACEQSWYYILLRVCWFYWTQPVGRVVQLCLLVYYSSVQASVWGVELVGIYELPRQGSHLNKTQPEHQQRQRLHTKLGLEPSNQVVVHTQPWSRQSSHRTCPTTARINSPGHVYIFGQNVFPNHCQTSTLRMRTEMVFETLVCSPLNCLTQLIAQDNFIILSRWESNKSHISVVN